MYFKPAKVCPFDLKHLPQVSSFGSDMEPGFYSGRSKSPDPDTNESIHRQLSESGPFFIVLSVTGLIFLNLKGQYLDMFFVLASKPYIMTNSDFFF